MDLYKARHLRKSEARMSQTGRLSPMMPQNYTPRMALVFALLWGPEHPQLRGQVRVGELNSGQGLGAAVKGVP